MTPLTRANAAALIIPGALLTGALASQHLGGLYPCELCHWQRWPHAAALVLATLAVFVARPALIALAAVAILASGATGVFHAGVEFGWWPGVTACATQAGGGTLADIIATPLIACDRPQWALAGISLAGFNALFSIGGGFTILGLLRSRA